MSKISNFFIIIAHYVREFHTTLLPKVGQNCFLKLLLSEVSEKFKTLMISEELLAYHRNNGVWEKMEEVDSGVCLVSLVLNFGEWVTKGLLSGW